MRLSRFEVRWAETVGRTLIPRGSVGGTSDAVAVGTALAAEVRDSTWYIALLIRFGLWVVWLCPPFVLGGLRTFASLSEADGCTALERLLGSRVYPVRMAINFLKIALCGQLLGELAFLQRLDAYALAQPSKPLAAEVPEVEPARSAS